LDAIRYDATMLSHKSNGKFYGLVKFRRLKRHFFARKAQTIERIPDFTALPCPYFVHKLEHPNKSRVLLCKTTILPR
jgi:hypothetical protein